VITIVCLTDAGHLLAQRLTGLLSSLAPAEQTRILFKPKPFKQKVQQAFSASESLIFVCATGIVIRTLAEVLDNKHRDPAILVLDEIGQYVIPLLSGHEGGANQLASQVAKMLSAQLVSTTANAYLSPVYTVGMGCERHCPEDALGLLLTESVARAGLSVSNITAIASIDIKSNEVGLIALAKSLDIPFYCYSVDQLSQVEEQLKNPSQYVFKTVGVYGVAESAALVSAQHVASELMS
jgi:cobalt-precorrin 5A hydrolase